MRESAAVAPRIGGGSDFATFSFHFFGAWSLKRPRLPSFTGVVAFTPGGAHACASARAHARAHVRTHLSARMRVSECVCVCVCVLARARAQVLRYNLDVFLACQ